MGILCHGVSASFVSLLFVLYTYNCTFVHCLTTLVRPESMQIGTACCHQACDLHHLACSVLFRIHDQKLQLDLPGYLVLQYVHVFSPKVYYVRPLLVVHHCVPTLLYCSLRNCLTSVLCGRCLQNVFFFPAVDSCRLEA